MPARKASPGFTLIELMIVVALLAIFATLAVPSFGRMIADNRVQSAASEFQHLLQGARADAVTRRVTLTLARNDDGGWSLSQGETVLRTFTLPPGVSDSSDAPSFSFAADGTASTANGVTFSSDQSSSAYQVTLERVGFVKLAATTSATESSDQ